MNTGRTAVRLGCICGLSTDRKSFVRPRTRAEGRPRCPPKGHRHRKCSCRVDQTATWSSGRDQRRRYEIRGLAIGGSRLVSLGTSRTRQRSFPMVPLIGAAWNCRWRIGQRSELQIGCRFRPLVGLAPRTRRMEGTGRGLYRRLTCLTMEKSGVRPTFWLGHCDWMGTNSRKARNGQLFWSVSRRNRNHAGLAIGSDRDRCLPYRNLELF